MEGGSWGRQSRRLVLVVVWVSNVFVAGPIARADEPDDLIKQGIELRRKGRDGQALDLFKRANDLAPSARALAQMGTAEQALGMWSDAEIHLAAALAENRDPWIKKNRAILSKAVDFVRSHLGTLEVWGSPKGAEVLLGVTVVGALPLAAPLRVTAGTASVTVRAAGFMEVARVVEVPSGGVVRERFELAKNVVRAVTLAPTADVGGQSTHKPPAITLKSDPATAVDAPPASVWTRWWFWTLLGSLAAAGAVTAYVLTRPHDCPAGQVCDAISPP
jgi:hypothetical protein